MERSLLEAEANLDELDEPAQQHGPVGHPSGFVPASVSQSGFSPAGAVGFGTNASGSHASGSHASGSHAFGSHESGSHASGSHGAAPSGLHPRIESSGRRNGSGPGIFAGSQVAMSGNVSAGSVSGDRLADSLQSALGASSRSEAGLGSLQRAIRDASRAFTASRHAQEALTEELRVMHRGLNEVMSEKAAVERYAALLTQERDAALDAAEEARREAKREREFLLREQDRFIQLLLEEHEAEVQQLRRGSSQAWTGGGDPTQADVAPATVPGMPATVSDLPVDGRSVPPRAPGLANSPPGELLSGAALARQALANAASSEASRPLPLPTDRLSSDLSSATQRFEDQRVEERAPSYPPAPTVLDLDALAAEVDGNSERPPPIQRLNVAEAKIHLKPARLPTQLDTLVSPLGEIDPNRKG